VDELHANPGEHLEESCGSGAKHFQNRKKLDFGMFVVREARSGV
jgi:hypothetical protein